MDKRYLEEDEDIVNRIEELRVPLKSHEPELARLQIEATLRNRKSLEDFNAATARFSIILVLLAFTQIVIAWFAFMVSLETIGNAILKWTFLLSLVGILVYLFRSFDKDFKQHTK